MSIVYLEDTFYDSAVAHLTAILRAEKKTAHNPHPANDGDGLQPAILQALQAAGVDGAMVLDPVFTDQRKGQSLITALASMDPDPATDDFERDQVHWTLWDAGVFPVRARVRVA